MKIKNLVSAAVICVFFTSVFARVGEAMDKWAKLDGNKVHYYDIGSKKQKNALVFIHGWTCNADFWKASYNAFPNHRVIVIDLPGHGQSDKPKINYTVEHFAKSVDAVMKHAGVKKAVFAGHSMGAPIARQFYRLHPERTLAIIVVDGPLRALAPKADMEKFVARMRADYKTVAAGYVDGLIKPIKDAAVAKFIRDKMLAAPDYVGISVIEGLGDENVWKADEIGVPVLAVMAPLAENWPPGLKEAYTKLAPDMEFYEWTGVGHFLMMERPDEFNSQVKTFIEKRKLL